SALGRRGSLARQWIGLTPASAQLEGMAAIPGRAGPTALRERTLIASERETTAIRRARVLLADASVRTAPAALRSRALLAPDGRTAARRRIGRRIGFADASVRTAPAALRIRRRRARTRDAGAGARRGVPLALHAGGPLR